MQTLVELLKILGLVEMDMSLSTLTYKVLQLVECVLTELDLRRVGQVEGLLVPIQVDELEAPG